ncbi:MAG: helix-turn-helix domain-containing protein [Rhizobiaceae bacterium]
MARSVPTYRLYGEESEQTGDFWLHCESLPERSRLHNWTIAEHRHDGFFQIFDIASGGGELLGGGGAVALSGPCLLFVPPGAIHGFRFGSDVDGLVVTALADRLVSLAASDRRIAHFASSVRILDSGWGQPAHEASLAVRRLAVETGRRDIGSAVMLEALATMAVVALARASLAGRPQEGEPVADPRLEQLETLVAAHYREHRPAHFYAARIGISVGQLNRIARSATGATVQGLTERRLIDQARREIVFTPTPVQAIAYSLGFSDPAYFNRFFRKHTGTTPGRFRASERKKSVS